MVGRASGGGRSPATLFRGGAVGNSPEFVESGVPGLVLACGLAWEVVRITRNPLGVEPGSGRPWNAAATAGAVLGHGACRGWRVPGLDAAYGLRQQVQNE